MFDTPMLFLYGSVAVGLVAALWHRRQERLEREQEERFWKALPEAWVNTHDSVGGCCLDLDSLSKLDPLPNSVDGCCLDLDSLSELAAIPKRFRTKIIR